MLPRTTFLLPLNLPPGKHTVTITFPDSQQTWRGIIAPDHGEAAYYMRLTRFTSGAFAWPPANLNMQNPPVSPAVAEERAAPAKRPARGDERYEK
jgi:hypothetical protein